MKVLLVYIVVLLLVGCSADEPYPFLDLPEDQERTARDETPGIDSTLANIVVMSKVMLASRDEYEKYKAEGKIAKEEIHGDFRYFSVEDEREVPMPNRSALVLVTYRFKTPL